MDINELKDQLLPCSGCSLFEECTHQVFGDGNPDSGILFVGEGPGQQEDLQGLPFVGPAGQLLTEMLNIIDLDRKHYYITNIVKCRPPKNRDPKPDEIQACSKLLARQMDAIRPRIVVCLGRISASSLIHDNFRITKEHGVWTEKDGVYYLATFHPSALLRNEMNRPEAFNDLLAIREKIRELEL